MGPGSWALSADPRAVERVRVKEGTDMAEEAKGSRAAGWKQDPSGRFAGRFWDGSGWTEHVVGHDKVTSTDPVPAALRQPAAPTRPVRGDGTADPGFPAAGGPSGVPRWARIVVPLAVVVFIGVAMTRPGSDNGSPAATTAPTAERPAPATKVYYMGETARTGDFDVTVLGFTDPQPPGDVLPPRVGMHYVSVDVELSNRSSRQQAFSSLLGFLLIDAVDQEFDASFGDVTPPAPDGDVAAGQTVRGLALFEVPDGTSGYRIRVRASLTVPGVDFTLG